MKTIQHNHNKSKENKKKNNNQSHFIFMRILCMRKIYTVLLRIIE